MDHLILKIILGKKNQAIDKYHNVASYTNVYELLMIMYCIIEAQIFFDQ